MEGKNKLKISKLNILTCLLLTLFLFGITNSAISGDKWKIKNITASHLGGDDDLEFKINFENTAGIKSAGDEFSITVKLTNGSRVIDSKTITVNPPKISNGSNFNVSVEFPRPNNYAEYEELVIKIEDNISNGINIKGLQKSFKTK